MKKKKNIVILVELTLSKPNIDGIKHVKLLKDFM